MLKFWVVPDCYCEQGNSGEGVMTLWKIVRANVQGFQADKRCYKSCEKLPKEKSVC